MKDLFGSLIKEITVYIDENDMKRLASNYVRETTGIELPVELGLDKLSERYFLLPNSEQLTKSEKQILSLNGYNLSHSKSFTNEIMYKVFNVQGYQKLISGKLAIVYREEEYMELKYKLSKLE